jgi:di/tricarboxylate transporter
MELRAGDVLLLQGEARNFAELRESEAVLLVEGLEQTIAHRHRRFTAIAIMLAVVVAASLFDDIIPIIALSGAALMLLTRCLRFDEALRSLNASVLLLLAGTIPLGIGMTKTGMAEGIVDTVMGAVGNAAPVVMISVFYILTVVITALLSNSATAVLLTPLALSLAAHVGVDPKPFLVAIAFGASADFSTPIGYQTNTIVMGPGGYRFSDYLRVGIPLEIIMWILATILIPIFWPPHALP